MSTEYVLPEVVVCDKVEGVTEPSHKGRCTNNYTISVSYRNSLGYSVSIIDRNNLITKIPYSGYQGSGAEFVVEYRLMFNDNVNLNWDSLLNESTDAQFINAIKMLRNNQSNKPNIIGNELIVEYTIKHREFHRHNSCAYYTDLDIVLVKSENSYNVAHPFSSVGQNLLVSNAENTEGFYYRVIINDPFNEFGERFININGGVYKVKRTVDHSVRPGVHVHTKDRYDVVNSSKAYEDSMYYSFSEADEKLHLYTTCHLAATLGDIHRRREEEIQDKELENKRRAQELTNQKLELESRLKTMEFEHKETILKLEHENLKLKDDLDREKNLRESQAAKEKAEYEARSRTDKEYYEKRSHVRKDFNEYLKMAPAIITCITAIANIVVAAHKAGLMTGGK